MFELKFFCFSFLTIFFFFFFFFLFLDTTVTKLESPTLIDDSIWFKYSKPTISETKFGLEISGADITNAFDATGSSKFGTLAGEKDTQFQLFIFGKYKK